jgi:autophagy-related protein 2
VSVALISQSFLMSSWYSWYHAWLPILPTVDLALPSGIQRRFISFVLKRLLGHFLEPGQLDVNQVDSQIGSGFVQVKDLRLDPEVRPSICKGLYGH